jgi:hypothetical protein
VLLVGDDAQLQSLDADGAFAMLVNARTDVAELTEIRRFTPDCEKHATRMLRRGEAEVIGTYPRHVRLPEGTTEQLRRQLGVMQGDPDAGAFYLRLEVESEVCLSRWSVGTQPTLSMAATAKFAPHP